jgi:carbamoyltransferase
LAELLAQVGEPVVVVDGPAELGPRALGNRSILAPCTDPRMRDRLNKMKGREHYRPVAPICLVEDAAIVFDPGTPDPYMLFDHRVRTEWAGRIPAVVHHDGTARLQTVGAGNGSRVGEVLREYRDRTGIPVLCNTSANHAGRGFFPDVGSAIEWGQCDYVWSSDTLHIAPGAADPVEEARR